MPAGVEDKRQVDYVSLMVPTFITKSMVVPLSLDGVPKVSVLIITYNHERFIKQALESVLMQDTNFRYEVVVGEDCSTDGTRNIILQHKEIHPHKIRLLPHSNHQGVVANFINTFKECRGEYVAILEGDDYWTSPLKLQTQVDFLEAHNDYSICFHMVQLLGEEADWESDIFPGDQGIRGVFPKNLTKNTFDLEDLLISNFIPSSSVVFRNHLDGKLPDWCSQLKFLDWPLHILNAEHGKIAFLNEIMGVYRLHSGGAWQSADATERTEAVIEMLERINAHLKFRYDKLINNTINNTILLRFEQSLLSRIIRSVGKHFGPSGPLREKIGKDFVKIMCTCMGYGFRFRMFVIDSSTRRNRPSSDSDK